MKRIHISVFLILTTIFIISGSIPAFADESYVYDNVILDNDICRVMIDDFKYNDELYAFTACVTFVNKTGMNLFCSMDCISVNKYMCEAYIGTSVGSYNESTALLTFDREDFEKNSIKEVQEMEFKFSAYDNDDWASECISEEICTVYPFGKDYTPQPDQKFDKDDIVLVNNDDCTMIITGFETDQYFFMANIYLENKTDIELEYMISGSTSVNDYCISPYFYKDVMGGKKMNTTIEWYLSDFNLYGITNVYNLALDIVVSNANDWFADYIYSCSSFINVQ